MKRISLNLIRSAVCCLVLSCVAFAQTPPASGGGWRRVGDPPPNQAADPAAQPSSPQNYSVPAQLTIRPGTYVKVRVNEALSSDHNQVGDAFTATLVEPIVVEGVVVAQRGQTVGGRVAEAQKAGRVQGTSRLGLQLTDVTLVDGQNVPLQSQLISRSGPTSVGRDAGAIAATTGVGAAIGAGVNGGVGAGVGAAAGVVVGTIGVLLTRGHPTVVYPESVLTFRVEQPVTISTERAPQAFRYVDPREYERPPELQARMGPPPPPPPYYYYGPPYYPYYWGPAFGFYVGPRFYYGPRFYSRGGFYRGGFRR